MLSSSSVRFNSEAYAWYYWSLCLLDFGLVLLHRNALNVDLCISRGWLLLIVQNVQTRRKSIDERARARCGDIDFTEETAAGPKPSNCVPIPMLLSGAGHARARPIAHKSAAGRYARGLRVTRRDRVDQRGSARRGSMLARARGNQLERKIVLSL